VFAATGFTCRWFMIANTFTRELLFLAPYIEYR